MAEVFCAALRFLDSSVAPSVSRTRSAVTLLCPFHMRVLNLVVASVKRVRPLWWRGVSHGATRFCASDGLRLVDTADVSWHFISKGDGDICSLAVQCVIRA